MPPALDEQVSVTSPCGVGIWTRASTNPCCGGDRSTSLQPAGTESRIPSNDFSNGPVRKDFWPAAAGGVFVGVSRFAVGATVGTGGATPCEASPESQPQTRSKLAA